MKRSALSLLPILMATSALAGPATQDGADHIVKVFQTYLGATAGVISAKVDGDHYALTVDAAPLLAQAQAAGVTATITPLAYALTDNGDGTWAVKQDQALSVSISDPGKMELKEDVAKLTLDGTFDEKLMTFSAAKGTLAGIKVSTTQTLPEGQSTAEASIDQATFESTGAAGASGGVDVTAKFTASGLTETVNAPMGQGAPAQPVAIKAATISEDVKGSGLMIDGFYKIAAWFVAHPDEAAQKADKANFKGILTAALPVWGNIQATGTIDKVTVGTPMGDAGLDQIGFTLDMNGAVADGKFREAITVSGLTPPAGIVPDWAMAVLPKKVSLDVQVTDFDAAGGITAGLGYLDLPDGMADTTDLDKAVQAAFLPKGNVTITLNPGGISGDGYELTYEGAMTAGPQTQVPGGTAKITLSGIDKLQAALAKAPDDMKAQAMMGLGMAQGMAKPDGDKLVWEIDASDPTSIKVNGTPLMGGQ